MVPFRERLPGTISKLGKGTAVQRGPNGRRSGGEGSGAQGVVRGGVSVGGSASGGGGWNGSTSAGVGEVGSVGE